ARERLERRDDHRLDAEARGEGRQRERDHHGGAVGVRDDEPTAGRLAGVEQRELVGVHLRDQQGHRIVHAVRRRIGHDPIPRTREPRLDRPGDVGWKAGEHDVAIERRLGGLDDERGRRGGHVARQPPGARLRVGSALRAIGGRQRRHGELGMALEQLQEALPDRTRRPEDADPNLPHRCSLTHRTPAASIEHTYNRSARGDLPRIAATLNKVLKSDRPRRGIARALLFSGGRGRRMRASVTVRVPGSTANLGAGFDCVGVAVPRWLRLTARLEPRGGRAGGPLTIERAGTLRALETLPDADYLYLGFAAACRRAGRDVPAGLVLAAESEIPVARGLGSSAAAGVAGAAAAAALLDLSLDAAGLAELATELEGHPDNVAPAVFGGATLALQEPNGLVVAPLVVHASLAFVFAVPDFMVETKRARAALPTTLPHGQAVRAAAKSAALVQGLAHGDGRLLAAALD